MNLGQTAAGSRLAGAVWGGPLLLRLEEWKESMVERVIDVIRAAKQQGCRVQRIRLPLWAYFELMCDFQDAGVPYPVGADVARVCGVPVLRDTATELALDRLGRQLQPMNQAAPVLH